MDTYMTVLYKQFCETKGIPFDIQTILENGIDPFINREFMKWIENSMVGEFRDYLEYLDLHDFSDIAEVDKGKYDTISKNDMAILSSYAYTMGLSNINLHIKNGFVYTRNGSKLITPERKVLLTHNPYDSSIVKWPSVQKQGRYGICIGFYGLKTDANFNDRMNLARTLIKNVDENCRIDYDFDDEKYFITLNSTSKVKTKWPMRKS